MLSDEIQYRLLKLLHAKPHLSQRDVAQALKISLGKANYCLKVCAEKGWIEVEGCRSNDNRVAYRYLLTKSGIQEKTCVTVRFLKRKQAEYKALQSELGDLQREVGSGRGGEKDSD
jgi:EPS-associated MarR family transcriptional regulator